MTDGLRASNGSILERLHTAAGTALMNQLSRSRRTSFWVRTLEVARERGDWVKVPRYYTQATAAQLTSDILNAAHRDPSTVRIKGIRPGEQWDARWGQATDGPRGDHVVWIRFLGAAAD